MARGEDGEIDANKGKVVDQAEIDAAKYLEIILSQRPDDELIPVRNEIRKLDGKKRAALLRLLSDRICEGRRDPVQRAIDAQQIRKWLDPWDAMLICSDLSVPNEVADIRMLDDSHKRDGAALPIVHRRMMAVAAEPFHWDKDLHFVEITLFNRADMKAREQEEQESTDTIVPVLHCYVARSASVEIRDLSGRGGEAKARSTRSAKADAHTAAVREQLSRYRDLLKKYVAERGTSILQDGHTARDPRAALPGREGIPMRSPAANAQPVQIEIFSPERVELRVPRSLASVGDDDVFVSTTVNRVLDKHLEGSCVVHFMEGIDENFNDPDNRKGTVAHMFLVFDKASDKPSTTAEFTRNIQTLLLRFCAYVMAAEADKQRADALAQQRRAEEREQEITQERNNLRNRARDVKKSIEDLQRAAMMLQTHLVENPTISRFESWVEELRPLLRTNEIFPGTPDGVRVRGDHYKWSPAQLAAALWAYARPEVPSWLNGSSIEMDRLWDSVNADWSNEARRNNQELYILHRLRMFDSLKRLNDENLQRTFWAFKRWHKFRVQRGAETSDSVFRFGQILFLLGSPNFNLYGANDADALDDEVFEFPRAHMLDGMIRFTNSIARGFIELDKHKPIEQVDIIGGVADDGIKLSLVNWVVRPGEEIPGCLEVRIRQHPLLAHRENATPRESFKRLMDDIVAAGVSGERDLDRWTRQWTDVNASKETSTAAAQALGCSAHFPLLEVGGSEEARSRYAQIARRVMDDDSDFKAYSSLGSGKHVEPLARLEVDVDTNEFIFTIKPRKALRTATT